MSNPIADAIRANAEEARLSGMSIRQQRMVAIRQYAEFTSLMQQQIIAMEAEMLAREQDERAAYEAAASADASDGMARRAA